jgi:cold shock protein
MTEPCGIDVLVGLHMGTRADFHKEKQPWSLEHLEKPLGARDLQGASKRLKTSRIRLISTMFVILPAPAACSPCTLLETTPNSDETLRDGRVAKDAGRRFQRRPDMAQGTVKFFNSQKGFGFIQPTDGGKDVFVHISAVERAGMSSLNEGQKVSFDVVSERGKLAAANLQAI